MPHLLGIDIGTSGTKTLICDEDGKVLATAMAEHPISSPKPGWSEQDPEDWWQATCRGHQGGAEEGEAEGGRRRRDRAVGADARQRVPRRRPQSRCGRPCSGTTSGRPSSARRSKQKAGGREALIELVANPALTGFTAPKILWVRQNEPRVYERTKHILLPKDYIRYRMTGEYATEVSDASGTLLLDVVNRTWSDKLLGLLDIDKALLPRLHESPEVTGTLHAEGGEGAGTATPGFRSSAARAIRRPARWATGS